MNLEVPSRTDIHELTPVMDEAALQTARELIVGAHGRSGVTRLFLGSVAESVVRHAHCPVLVCKPKQAE